MGEECCEERIAVEKEQNRGKVKPVPHHVSHENIPPTIFTFAKCGVKDTSLIVPCSSSLKAEYKNLL